MLRTLQKVNGGVSQDGKLTLPQKIDQICHTENGWHYLNTVKPPVQTNNKRKRHAASLEINQAAG